VREENVAVIHWDRENKPWDDPLQDRVTGGKINKYRNLWLTEFWELADKYSALICAFGKKWLELPCPKLFPK
jgi:hypothetical protein